MAVVTKSAEILEPKKIKSVTVSTVSPSICHEVVGEMGVPRVQVLEPASGGHGGSRGLRLGVCGVSWNGKRLRDEMMGGGDSRYRQGHGKRLGGRSDLRASLLAW